MRFITLLQSTIPSPTLDDTSPPSSTCHIFDRTIYDKFMALSQLYKSDHHFRTHYRRIYRYLHPFETIRTTVRSRFIPNCPPLKITNAFMKMYEMLEHLDKYIPSSGTLRMYDVAGAPGMFVIAVEQYLRETKRETILEWQASSLVDNKDALCDLYGLYAKNLCGRVSSISLPVISEYLTMTTSTTFRKNINSISTGVRWRWLSTYVIVVPRWC